MVRTGEPREPGAAAARDRFLLERESELAVLSGALTAARAGAGSLLLIEGPAGIGKTELVGAFREEANAQRLTVLEALSTELESEVPFAVVQRLFSTLLADTDPAAHASLLSGRAEPAGALLEPAAIADPAPLPVLVGALCELSINLSACRPLAIVVDDAHWTDRPSMTFLSHLALRLQRLPVSLVLAVRSGEAATAQQLLSALRASAGVRTLRPSPLSDLAVGMVLEGELTAPHPSFVTACAAVSGGNPFLTRELALALRSEGVEPVAASVPRVEQLVPATVLHSSLTRLARLGEDARAIAVAASVLGDGGALRHAVALSGLDPRGAERAADALAAAGILQPGEPLRFIHPLLATAVHSDLPAFTRAHAHRQAAAVLAADGAGPVEVAAHLLLTRGEQDPWVVRSLREAARLDLAHGDPQAAVHLLVRALAEPPPGGERAEVLLELAHAEAVHGLTGAKAHAREALDLTREPEVRVGGLRLLGQIEVGLGDRHAAARALQEALKELDPGHPDREEILAEYLTVNRFAADLAGEAKARLAPLVTAARQGAMPHEPGLMAHVGLELALETGDLETVRALVERATARDPAIDGSGHGIFVGMLVQALCLLDDLDTGERLASLALGAARERGNLLGSASGAFHRAIGRYHRGALGDALEDLDEALGPLREGWASGAAWPQALLVHLQIDRGNIAAAAGTAEAIDPLPGTMDEAVVGFARARVAMARRSPSLALNLARAAGEELQRDYGFDDAGLFPWRAVAARAALAAGDAELAKELAAEQQAKEHGRAPRSQAIALRTTAAVHGGARGRDALQEAARVMAGSPSRLERARCLLDLGAALRRDGHRSEARLPLLEALQLADEMSAAPLAKRSREELQALGVRPRRAAFTGVDSLTPAEARVARLAAEGLTNVEIARELVVTARTVQTHLAHTYRKLEISSRRHLAHALAEDRDRERSRAQPRSPA